MEDELLPPPPPKRDYNKTAITGDDGLLPPPPLKKYTPFIERLKDYFSAISEWWRLRPKFPSKWQESDSPDYLNS